MTPRQRIVVVTAAVGLLLAIVVVVGLIQMLRSPAARTVSVAPASTRATKPNAGTPAWPGFTFEDGTFWQLTGLREYPDGTQWWGGNGATLKEPQAPKLGQIRPEPNMRMIELRFRATSIEDAFKRQFVFRLPDRPRITAFALGQSHVVTTGAAIFPLPPALDRVDVEVGLASGPPVEHLHADIDFNGGAFHATTRPAAPFPDSSWKETFGKIVYENGRLDVEISDDLLSTQRVDRAAVRGSEVLLTTRTGRPFRYTSLAWREKGLTYRFVIPKEQIGSVGFQSRAVQWLTLPNVPLRPKTPLPATTRATSKRD